MLKRRFKKKSTSFVLHTSNRGSDIVKPENTSLIVNDSDTETDELPKEITSVLMGEDSFENINRESTSLMKSLSQKTQSTPKNTYLNKMSQKPKKSIIPEEEKENMKDECYFDEVLKMCGVVPLCGSSSYQLSLDQAVIAIKINDILKENHDNREMFLNALKKKTEKIEYFQKMLIHTLTEEDCDVARGPVQESLMRILLNVECIQLQLIETILDKLADLVLDCEDNEKGQMISSLLRQMRFLNAAREAKIANRIFEIIDVASINIQREIIFMLPEIISEEETEEVSVKLIEMLKQENSLTNVVVDTVTNLSLSKTTRSQVRIKIMNRLDKCPTEFLPSLIQFILSKCDEDEYTQIVNGLRKNLPFTVQHQAMREQNKKNKDEDSYVKLSFEILKFSAMASKSLADIWMKIIASAQSADDLRCLDLMVLIIFCGSLHGRKNQVLTLIRSKVKSGILTDVHVTNTFKILTVVASEYFTALLEVASTLIKSPHQTIADFGALLYKQCFVHFHYYMEQSVVNELLLHIGTGTPVAVTTALLALRALCNDHKESLCQHTVSIMGILVKILDLDPAQIRLVVDVIADLIFFKSATNAAGWQDELQIFIRKQLSSSKVEVCKKGIIAAIMLGKHAAMLEEDADYEFTQINTLLDAAMGSSGTCDVRRGFFNDEFATMLQESSLNRTFLKFWRKKIQNVVADNLFVRNIDIECEHFPMSLQYGLEDDDSDSRSVFPVVDIVITSQANKFLAVPIAVIPSALRLLWCCERNSELVPPAFTSSVVLPEVTVLDNFHSFDEDRKKLILDCLFLCANYLIECINAFCAKNHLDKALMRLKQLIRVRRHIGSHILTARDYTPPLCQFYAPVSRPVQKKQERGPKKGKKRKADGEQAPNVSLPAGTQTQVPGTPSQVPASHVETEQAIVKDDSDDPLVSYEGYFRLLNVNCVKLLKTDLSSETPGFRSHLSGVPVDEKSWSSRSRPKLELDTEDALFLLEDSIRKAKEILGKPRGNFGFKGKTLPSTVGEATAPEVLLTNAVDVLPALMKKIVVWSNYCKELLNENDGILDGLGMYPKDSREIKLALAAAFKFLEELVCWHGFQKPVNKSLLIDVLTAICKRGSSSSDRSRVPLVSNIASNAAAYLSKFHMCLLLLNGGLSLAKTVQACYVHSSSVESSSLLADLCLGMLQRPWFTVRGTPERGAVYNQHVDALLKMYFSTVRNRLDVVRDLARTSLEEMERLTDKNETMNAMKSVSRSNFPLLYRALADALVSAATEELTKNGSDESRLQIWSVVVETMVTLVDIVKIQTSRINLVALLKRSQSIIQLFFAHGMPIIEVALRVNSLDVLKLLKCLQTVTRYLHSVCCHSKITSDSLVASHVPVIRAQCERLTLEVKGVLISNKIPMECITIAVLKNKDLKGNDILSQESVEGDSDDESELPAEDNEEASEDIASSPA